MRSSSLMKQSGSRCGHGKGCTSTTQQKCSCCDGAASRTSLFPQTWPARVSGTTHPHAVRMCACSHPVCALPARLPAA